MFRPVLKYTLPALILLGGLDAQTEVIIISDNVGAEIDEHENRFYRVFPEEKGLVDAQIVRINENKYRILVVKNVDGKITKVRRYIDQNEFDTLKKYVDLQPRFTEKEKIAMYEGMDFLRAEKIVNEIPRPQFVVLKYSGKKKLKGTLFNVEDNVLYIQTPTTIEMVSLNNLDKLSYRTVLGEYEYLRPYIYGASGATGLALARLYNTQRPTLYNDFGIPRNDLIRYTQLLGIVIGLIFSSEVFDAVSTLLTPAETIILSEAEYESKNIK
tara:strand:- start:443 stop:1252 length:810 start_codon:yes stop_codon:yes gene_type:complete